ncbi:MAG: xanthine dehydrogenase family protein molybdopterin-binding subunit [Nitrospinota bacterium]
MPEFSVIGKPIPPVDAPLKVAGRTDYVGDMSLPRMLHAKILRGPHAHARIVHIDASRARKLPGVKALLTGRDIPPIRWGTVIDDQTTLAIERVLYVGQEVAAVAAVDEAAALDALELIDVEYAPLPAVMDPEAALADAAPKVHESGNVATRIDFTRGDPDAGFREADVILDETYRTSIVSQAYMEPMGALAQADGGGGVRLWMPCQSIFYAQRRIAKALGLPLAKVRVIQAAVGGSFGGKRDEPLPMIAALLAQRAGAPVKLLNTRLEEFQAGRPRLPMALTLKMGIKKDGTLTAKECKGVADAGAYSGEGIGIFAAGLMRMDNHYRQMNVRTEGLLVYTNTIPKGAFRGYGNPQVGFAVEQHMDALAEAVGMDPAELRLKNAVRAGETTVHGWKLESCALDRCIREVMEKGGWKAKRAAKAAGPKRRGIGLACAIHSSGARVYGDWDGSYMEVKLDAEGGVTIVSGEGDIGQGAKTVLAQIVAEELGVPVEDVALSAADTATSPLSFGAYASRLTVIGGNAVRLAAQDARRQLLEAAAERLEARTEDLDLKDGFVSVRNAPERRIAIGEAVNASLFRRNGRPLVGRGVYDAPNDFVLDKALYGNFGLSYEFTALAVEVEVDVETGGIELIGAWVADDVGFALNPLTAEGQVQGAVVQGLGYALTEGLVFSRGQAVNGSLADYALPKAESTGAVRSTLIESNDPLGPYGAKGASEAPIDPVAAAVANAVYHATGKRIRDLPITSEKILALHLQGGKAAKG